MRLATIKLNHDEIAGIVTEKGVLPVKAVNAQKGTAWEETMLPLIEAGQVRGLTEWYNAGGKAECEAIPGGVLSTGTPLAFGLADGDIAECRIVGPDGFSMEPLKNPVVDLKKHPEKA